VGMQFFMRSVPGVYLRSWRMAIGNATEGANLDGGENISSCHYTPSGDCGEGMVRLTANHGSQIQTPSPLQPLSREMILTINTGLGMVWNADPRPSPRPRINCSLWLLLVRGKSPLARCPPSTGASLLLMTIAISSFSLAHTDCTFVSLTI